uniref:Pol polyprotein n=1 Tax=Lygus hesperus TaxID=30085 RepID=A0A146LQD6_LYGHE
MEVRTPTRRHATLKYHIKNWSSITDNRIVLDWVLGYSIPFKTLPFQPSLNRVSCPKKDLVYIEDLVAKLEASGAIEQCSYTEGQFLSPIFLVDKPSGDKRLILNLKRLNEFVSAPPFRLEDHRTVRQLVWQGAYGTVVDISDAYYAVNVRREHRKYLRFMVGNDIFQFKCLPFGLSSAPYTFVKLMKPILAHLRSQGVTLANYLDDFVILGHSSDVCETHANKLIELLTSLGFIINVDKCCLKASTSFTFLGFLFDSERMLITLPPEKAKRTKHLIDFFINNRSCSIRDFAKLIGNLVSLCPASPYGWIHIKRAEKEKSRMLHTHDMNYDAEMYISDYVLPDLNWWSSHVNNLADTLRRDSFSLSFDSDSSLTGWGAVSGDEVISGWWSEEEQLLHINILELKAIFVGLQHFASNLSHCNVIVRADNSTAIACVNRQGTVRSESLLTISRQLWEWCESRNIFIRATYIPSKENFRADEASRRSPEGAEWSLHPTHFLSIIKYFGVPSIDLFASAASAKCPVYV